MKKEETIKEYELIVVGGGLSGICASIAAAREGIKTALIQNRPVLGGNSSSEVKLHVLGADYHASRDNARETGIIEEILLENRKRNPQHSYSIFDTILWEKANFQDNLDLYLNTHMNQVNTINQKIISVSAEQLTTEKLFKFKGKIFIDATGDGTLGYLAGAEYMSGREGKDIFDEKFAPKQSDNKTMGSSILMKAKKMNEVINFEKPFWAKTFTENDLKYRDHHEKFGFWWVEIGGDKLDTIKDAEQIRDELLKTVYGVWDHIKNHGDHGADKYALDWIGFLPGKRESRRLKGDYVLKEQDLFAGKRFEDAVAYGGWPMDIHTVGGIDNADKKPTDWIEMDDLYTIPYRSLYSKNIKNLFLGGRAISVSHIAFGSTRVMATCSVIGQALGTASALAIRKKIELKKISQNIDELQQKLLKEDCYIPGIKNKDSLDIARKAKVKASSCIKDSKADYVINGVARTVKENLNCWISKNMKNNKPEWLCFKLNKKRKVKEIRIKFDSNLSQEITITLFPYRLSEQKPGLPAELVKDYDLEFYNQNKIVHIEKIRNNYQRNNIINFSEEIECNQVKLKVLSTHGTKNARVFEVRIY